jgi:hypothetical protein
MGVHGNGHMMMIEKNNAAIAGVIAQWLERQHLRERQVNRPDHQQLEWKHPRARYASRASRRHGRANDPENIPLRPYQTQVELLRRAPVRALKAR